MAASDPTRVLPAGPSVTLTVRDESGTSLVTADIAVLRLEPGDTLVLFTPERTPTEQLLKIGETMRRAFPEHRSVVLLDIHSLGIVRG